MDAKTPPLLEMLAGLIAAPSMSSVSPAFDHGNREVIDLLAQWCEELGFNVEVLPVMQQPEKANLIATLGSGPGGLVLAGHTDTVPYDAGRWQHDPFQLTRADDRLYGLGICDMKGFFALALEAARRFVGRPLKAPLILVATADEESSMDGAKALVELGRPRGRYAVVGEPTGLRPVNAHKGILMEAIHLIGHSGHSSDPGLGRNALDGMYEVMGQLIAWREALRLRYRDEAFKVPYPTLNLGHIHGGDNPNRICGECELHIDLRLMPGMDPDAMRRELEEQLAPVAQRRGLTLEIRPLFFGAPPMATPQEAELVRAAEGLTGYRPETVAFCTEGPFFTELGMETLILGPGDIAQAHQPDEFLALDRLDPTVELLSALIRRFCL